eukprot:4487702-Pleurochrysis_carterae.AAC.2
MQRPLARNAEEGHVNRWTSLDICIASSHLKSVRKTTKPSRKAGELDHKVQHLLHSRKDGAASKTAVRCGVAVSALSRARSGICRSTGDKIHCTGEC